MLKQPHNLEGMKNVLDIIIKPLEYGSEEEAVKKDIIDFYTNDVDLKDKKIMSLKQCQVNF